jgi:hypothetical protein
MIRASAARCRLTSMRGFSPPRLFLQIVFSLLVGRVNLCHYAPAMAHSDLAFCLTLTIIRNNPGHTGE